MTTLAFSFWTTKIKWYVCFTRPKPLPRALYVWNYLSIEGKLVLVVL